MLTVLWQREQPNVRPVVVTRSFVPGMQAFAHGSWSGDNSTSWLSLKWSTKMTLSVGLSCGPGLYGHDIGGGCLFQCMPLAVQHDS